MNILVTGSKGMVGLSLINNLKNIRDGKDLTHASLNIEKIYEYDISSSESELEEYCKNADFVFNFAGVNRPEKPEDFVQGNCGFSSVLLQTLKKYGNKCPVMLSSSIQATLEGRFSNSEYGKSKKLSEELFFSYAEETGVPVYVYRFPNIMGHSRPNYNSAVSTFCWAIANNKPYFVNDRATTLELLYIDDLIEGMFDLMLDREKHCDFDGTEAVENEAGKFCYIPKLYNVSLGEIVDLLESFKLKIGTLSFPRMKNGSFEKKLYSLFLSYLPVTEFEYDFKMNKDNRGSFTEIFQPEDFGQVSVNISKPGITKGQHWHNSKWEIFIVVQGHGLIRERNINTNEEVEFEVSGEKMQGIYMIPGWTHEIINLSNTENLVTVMIANEVFNPEKPDTFSEKVKI